MPLMIINIVSIWKYPKGRFSDIGLWNNGIRNKSNAINTNSTVSYTASIRDDCEWLYIAKRNSKTANKSPEKKEIFKINFSFFRLSYYTPLWIILRTNFIHSSYHLISYNFNTIISNNIGNVHNELFSIYFLIYLCQSWDLKSKWSNHITKMKNSKYTKIFCYLPYWFNIISRLIQVR